MVLKLHFCGRADPMHWSHMTRWLTGILLVGSIALVPAAAQATTILPGCGTCGDSTTTWDLTLALLDDANNIYQLTATATYGTPNEFVFVNAIAFKIDAFIDSYDATPTVTGPPESGWTLIPGGVSAAGCTGSGNGFFCANSTGAGAAHGGAGATDVWTFLLDVNNSLPNLVTSPGSFKAQFSDAAGFKEGPVLSEAVTYTTTPVDVSTPEPATLILFGTGLAAIATAIRRRRKT
jgi:PEP-CTERM motif-containing protein